MNECTTCIYDRVGEIIAYCIPHLRASEGGCVKCGQKVYAFEGGVCVACDLLEVKN